MLNNSHSKAFKDFLLLLVLLLFAFWPLVGGIASLKWDIINLTFPWNYFISECLHLGELPLWNPYINGGFTQMGNPDTWYAPHWILAYVWGFDIYAMQFSYLLHLYLGGIGFYVLGQQHQFNRIAKVGTAASYMLSGFALSHAQHLGWITGMAWLPWLWWAVRHLFNNPQLTNAFLLSIIGHFYVTGAYPGLSIIGFYLIAGLCFYQFYQYRNKTYSLRKTIGLLSLSIFLMLVLSSPCLISVIDIAPTVNRGVSLSLNEELMSIYTGDLSWPGLFSFLFPFATSTDHDFWSSPELSILNCYIGIVPLLVIGVMLLTKPSLRSPAFICLSLGILLLMTAIPSVFPFRKWLYHGLPLMGYFRFPTLFRLGSIFFLLLAAGHFLSRKKKFEYPQAKYFIIGFSILGLSLLLLLLYQANQTTDQLFNISEINNWQTYLATADVWKRISLQSGLHLLLILTFLICLFFLPRRHYAKALLLFWLIDLFGATQLQLYVTVVGFHPPQLIKQECASLTDYFPTPRLDVSLSTLSKIPAREQRRLKTNLNIFHKTPTAFGDSPFSFNYMNKALKNGHYQDLVQHPLFFLASKVEEDSSILSENIIPYSSSNLHLHSFSPGESILKVNTKHPCYLVFTQNYYHRWSAYIDQQAQEIRRVNDTFMAVALDQGSHDVRFIFEFPALKVAVYISAFLCFILWSYLIYGYITFLLEKSYFSIVIIVFAVLVLLFLLSIYQNFNRTSRLETLEELETILEFIPDTFSVNEYEVFLGQESSPQTNKFISELPLWYPQDHHTITEKLSQVETEHILICEYAPLPFHKASWLPYAKMSYGSLVWQDSSQRKKLYLLQKEKVKAVKKGELLQTWPKVVRDSLRYVSQRQSAFIKSSHEYLNLFREKIDSSNRLNPAQSAFVTFDLFSKSTSPGLIIFEIHRNEKRLKWFSQIIQPRERYLQQWQRLSVFQDLQTPLEDGDELRIYIWNNKGVESWIDNVSLKLYN